MLEYIFLGSCWVSVLVGFLGMMAAALENNCSVITFIGNIFLGGFGGIITGGIFGGIGSAILYIFSQIIV